MAIVTYGFNAPPPPRPHVHVHPPASFGITLEPNTFTLLRGVGNFGMAGTDTTVVSLPMAAADTVHGSLTTYIDFDSPMGTNIYEPVRAVGYGGLSFRRRVGLTDACIHGLALASRS